MQYKCIFNQPHPAHPICNLLLSKAMQYQYANVSRQDVALFVRPKNFMGVLAFNSADQYVISTLSHCTL
ncbi:unnamed protein product [Brugia timori]|uniref:Uncharacterized protein n=1 Tax=Brugia timori TaxID=42155 RepID=A0A0R3RCX5_9BILA|nr:unnamed protein product [Brugia timori]